MNEPSQLSHFLEAPEKNRSLTAWGREEGRCAERSCAEKCFLLLQGTREPLFSKYTFSRHSHAVYPMRCYAPHLRAKLPDVMQASRHSYPQEAVFNTLSSLATTNHHKTCLPLLTLTAKPKERASILSPSWAALIWIYLTLQKECPGVSGLIQVAHT